jgi:RNA polymerase-interacting CarD/CdnL/TRCF family regulator
MINVNDLIHVPGHGVLRVTEIGERHDLPFITAQSIIKPVTLMLPYNANASYACPDRHAVSGYLAMLSLTTEPDNRTWSFRYRHYMEDFRNSHYMQVAEIINHLSKKSNLCFGERKLLSEFKLHLAGLMVGADIVSSVGLALGIIDKHLGVDDGKTDS